MTVVANDRITLFAGDNVTTTFPFDFPIDAADQIKVYTVIDGVEAEMLSGFTVLPDGASYPCPYGQIQFDTAPASTVTGSFEGGTPIEQTNPVSANATEYSSRAEAMADKATKAIAELKTYLLRRFIKKVPGAQDLTGLDPSTQTDGTILGVVAGAWAFVTGVTVGTLTLVNVAADRIGVMVNATTMQFYAGLKYLSTTWTLWLKGSSTDSDFTLQIVDKNGVTVATVRSDGTIVNNTDLTPKSYVVAGDASVAADLAAAVGLAPKRLWQTGTTVDVTNSSTRLPLGSFTIPGGSMGANGRVHIRCDLQFDHDATPPGTFELSVDIGTAQKVIDIAVTPASWSTAGARMIFETDIFNKNDESVQETSGVLQFQDGSSLTDHRQTDKGSATQATASDKLVTVYAQWASADSSAHCRLIHGQAERM